MTDFLSSAANAQLLDKEASSWGLSPFALVEAAGRGCARSIQDSVGSMQKNTRLHTPPYILVLAGSGNNAADALVMLRALIFDGYVNADSAYVLITKLPGDTDTPLTMALRAVQSLGVPVEVWQKNHADLISRADIIIDGIAGTGVKGALQGSACEMALSINAGKRSETTVFSVDVPSGLFDGWQAGMPAVEAAATLAIEPQKRCLYTPAARLLAGRIIPVGGIFPVELMGKYRDAQLLCWEIAAALIAPVSETAHKYQRGLAEIHAGSPGAAGAAMLAARGAQAVGAGLVRLIVDPSLYGVLAPGAGGIMVAPQDENLSKRKDTTRFIPDAVLLGPGWGRGEDRAHILQSFLPLEEQGLPLILDADAIALAKGIVFHGNAILTPHPGEFAEYTGLSKEKVSEDPIPVLRQFAAEKNCTILLKGHVLYIAAPDGRIGIIDGMEPALAAGGSGDVLAGFCAGIAARCQSLVLRVSVTFDGFAVAAAAATLLIEAVRSKEIAGRFIDPGELPSAAARIAGEAWLGGRCVR